MTLLYFIPSLSTGGAELQTINQVNKLHEKGIEIHLVILSNQLPLAEKVILPKDQIHVLGISQIIPLRKASFKKLPEAVWALKSVLKQVNPSQMIAILPICHLIGRLCKLLFPGNWKLWLYHRSVQFEANPLDTIAKKVFHFLVGLLSRITDFGHIFISKAVEQNIKAFCLVRNGYVLHNAIPARNVSSSSAATHLANNHLPKPSYLIVIPGRLHPSKGHQFFLESLGPWLTSQTEEELLVCFAGGGPNYQALQSSISEMGLENYIFITGYIDNDLLLSYLALAQLVVIPSIHEGFGNVAVESLMQGATILASTTGGLPEIIRDGYNGFLFKQGDQVDLLNKLKWLKTTDKKLDPEILKKDFSLRFTLASQIEQLTSIVSEAEKISENKF